MWSTVEKTELISSSARGGSSRCGHGVNFSLSSDDRDRLKCEHCGRFRHTKEQCWHLHANLKGVGLALVEEVVGLLVDLVLTP